MKKSAIKKEVPSTFQLISRVLSSGRSASFIERALELPVGTLERWAKGKCASEERTLLRVLAEFPWLVEVADARFDRTVADKNLLFYAMEAMLRFQRGQSGNGNNKATA